ncbi:hypothetical protein [Nonomuraea gerenzanensis]|uniref:Uncharacterized protein n=1 Tax=Nonomuraea gerenzanensis TaxID=93944 RepID=A0A1M4EB42_9ACTN|nr:hypothetical protein [Nonomuraea gerenzanensis]SBO95952.1 hypothetical protein BN4615_P5468 [Nonomuraea gerenzanensis]
MALSTGGAPSWQAAPAGALLLPAFLLAGLGLFCLFGHRTPL